jgi:hypothetical protein
MATFSVATCSSKPGCELTYSACVRSDPISELWQLPSFPLEFGQPISQLPNTVNVLFEAIIKFGIAVGEFAGSISKIFDPVGEFTDTLRQSCTPSEISLEASAASVKASPRSTMTVKRPSRMALPNSSIEGGGYLNTNLFSNNAGQVTAGGVGANDEGGLFGFGGLQCLNFFGEVLGISKMAYTSPLSSILAASSESVIFQSRVMSSPPTSSSTRGPARQKNVSSPSSSSSMMISSLLTRATGIRSVAVSALEKAPSRTPMRRRGARRAANSHTLTLFRADAMSVHPRHRRAGEVNGAV